MLGGIADKAVSSDQTAVTFISPISWMTHFDLISLNETLQIIHLFSTNQPQINTFKGSGRYITQFFLHRYSAVAPIMAK